MCKKKAKIASLWWKWIEASLFLALYLSQSINQIYLKVTELETKIGELEESNETLKKEKEALESEKTAMEESKVDFWVSWVLRLES